MKKKQIKQY